MPAPNGSITAINRADQGGQCIEFTPQTESQLTKTREHPIEQLRRRKKRRGLGDSAGERGIEEHGGETQVAVICSVNVSMGTLGAGKDNNE